MDKLSEETKECRSSDINELICADNNIGKLTFDTFEIT
jgi:hypothetical protein